MKRSTGRTAFVVLTLLTLVVFTILVKLGFWQLGRGDEKKATEEQLKQRAVQPYIPLHSVTKNTADVIGLRVSTTVSTPEHKPRVYLDNQVHQGKAGYLVYEIMKPDLSSEYLLVELGFLDRGSDRSKLPDTPFSIEQGNIKGRLYTRMANPLSSDLMPESLTHLRIQNLNLKQLELELDLPLLPFVFQPISESEWTLPQPWKPLPMASSKHYGYAFQWFSMATVWLLLMVILFIRTTQKKKGS